MVVVVVVVVVVDVVGGAAGGRSTVVVVVGGEPPLTLTGGLGITLEGGEMNVVVVVVVAETGSLDFRFTGFVVFVLCACLMEVMTCRGDAIFTRSLALAACVGEDAGSLACAGSANANMTGTPRVSASQPTSTVRLELHRRLVLFRNTRREVVNTFLVRPTTTCPGE
jgi:hypothetical protein